VSYPRNAASPERVDIGPVIQISDGAVQTSGVAVKVIPFGGTEAAGGGTVAYSADGVVLYTPTQGETNYTSFVLVASKTGCIPASKTVVTSASATAGYAGLDWSKITAATTTVALTGTTISATQIAASVTAAVTVGVNNDKTGYTLTVTPPTAAAIADAVWDEPYAGHTTNGSYGHSVLIAANSNRTVQVTGSNHVAADIHELQPAVIDSTHFAANWLTAAGTASDYITELQTAIGTATNQTAIKTVTDRLSTGLVADGAVYQFTANMLELAPAGGGGGGSGDATTANQILILDQLDLIQAKTDLISGAGGITSLLAGAVLQPGTITSFPEVITIGDSYTAANGRAIQIPVVDTNGNPVSSSGSLPFSSATVSFTISRANETELTRIIEGTATFVDPPGTGTAEAPYVLIELLSSETIKGLKKYRYSGVLTFTWPGTSDEVVSFETDTEITFDN
jgi:hypothetical protein